MKTPFSAYLDSWSLVPDGIPIETHGASLLPVVWRDQPAMLKVSSAREETEGYDLLEWWGGDGAAKVFARRDPAILMERANGSRSLAELSRNGSDEEACRIICAVVSKLHATRGGWPRTLTPLEVRFRALHESASTSGGALYESHKASLELLGQPQDTGCLHGDIHHQNILDFEDKGWLAIDPKGLVGERAFDYANIFCNPDISVAGDFDRFLNRVSLVAKQAHLDPQRLMKWILAWAGLSATWHLQDGTSPDIAVQVARMAAGALRI